MSRLLLVEDDHSLGQTLGERLAREGHTVDWVQGFAEAIKASRAGRYDLLIVDVGLPDGNGFELVKELSSQGPRVPVLFMTALATAENRLLGYELGASDFLPKPFHLREFLIRVSRLVPGKPSEIFLFPSGARVDFASLRVSLAGQTEAISARDSAVLRLLVERSPAVVSRDEVLDKAWGQDQFPSHRTVDNCIVRLRSIIGDRDQTIIQTVRGVGYQILEPVQRRDDTREG